MAQKAIDATFQRVSEELTARQAFFFPVGVPLQIEIEGVTLRMRSTSAGYVANGYLIIRYPLTSISISTVLVKGRKITVRYIDHGTVFAFQSELIAVVDQNPGLLLISYPSRIVQQSLRSAKRIECALPASVFGPDSESGAEVLLGNGVIVDISGTGCACTVGRTLGGEAVSRLRIEDAVVVAFKLPGTEEDIRLDATVKRTQRDADNTTVGLRFKQMDNGLSARLKDFVTAIESFALDMH